MGNDILLKILTAILLIIGIISHRPPHKIRRQQAIPVQPRRNLV